MILPNTDISIMAVRNCLGYPSTDLGTLCTCDKVNMWSRYKPVIYNVDTTNGITDWYKGRYGNCGIKLQSYNSPLEAGKANWTLERPTGGVTSPYRLGDFRGYNHNAVPFLTIQAPENILIDTGKQSSCIFHVINQSVDSKSNLTWDDFSSTNYPLKDCYLACYIEKEGSPYINTIVTGDYPILTSTNDVEVIFSKGIGGNQFTLGTYNAYFLLCTQKIVQNGVQQGPTYFPIYKNPRNSYPVKLEIRNSLINPLSITVPQVGVGYSLGSVSFVNTDTVMDGTSGSLNLRNGDLFFKCVFKNVLTSGAYTFYKENLTLHVSDFEHNYYNITSARETIDSPFIYILDETGRTIEMVTVYNTTTLYVVVRNGAQNIDGNYPAFGTKWVEMVEFRVVPVNAPHDLFTVADMNLNMTYD